MLKFIILCGLTAGLLQLALPAAHAKRTDDLTASAEFCQILLGLPNVHFETLKQKNLITSIHRGIYKFDKTLPVYDPYLGPELDSLAKLKTFIPSEIHAIGNFGPRVSVPVVDGVLFPTEGQPVNVSIKVDRFGGMNTMGAIHDQISESIYALTHFYTAAHIAELFGLSIENNNLAAAKDLDEKRYRYSMARALIRTLGLEMSSDNVSRKLMLVLDHSHQIFQHAQISSSIPEDPASEKFLTIQDERIDSENGTPMLPLNLDRLVRQVQKIPVLQGFYILFHDRMLIVDRKGSRFALPLLTKSKTASAKSDSAKP